MKENDSLSGNGREAGIAADFQRGIIVMRFPEPVQYINFLPSHARDLARNLLDLASQIENKGKLVTWAVFKSPADHPGKYVGRRFIGEEPENHCIIADTLEDVRAGIPIAAMVRMSPAEGDVPALVETWI